MKDIRSDDDTRPKIWQAGISGQRMPTKSARYNKQVRPAPNFQFCIIAGLQSYFSIQYKSIKNTILTKYCFVFWMYLLLHFQLIKRWNKSIFQRSLVLCTLVEVNISDKISRHKAHLYFLMHNDPYFHVGYAPKINSGSTHNIKFQKIKFHKI